MALDTWIRSLGSSGATACAKRAIDARAEAEASVNQALAGLAPRLRPGARSTPTAA